MALIENTFSEFDISDCCPEGFPLYEKVEIEYFNGLPIVVFYKEEICEYWLTKATRVCAEENRGVAYQYKIQSWITKNNSVDYLSPDTLKNCKIHGKVILFAEFCRNGWRYYFEPTPETQYL